MFQLYFNLSDSIPNLTDWIQAICALVIVLFTWKMKNYAKDALNTWKEDKYDNYIVDAELVQSNITKEIMKATISIAFYLTTHRGNESTQELAKIITETDKKLKEYDFYGHIIKLSKIDSKEIDVRNTFLQDKEYYNKVKNTFTMILLTENEGHNFNHNYYEELLKMVNNYISSINRTN